MNKSALLLLILSITIPAQAGIFNAVSNIENNTDTSYTGGGRTISAYNHSYAINPLGLPITIKPKYDKDSDKPSFTIEQVTNESKRVCSWPYAERTYKVTGSDGFQMMQPLCVKRFSRSNLYVTIKADYTVELELSESHRPNR